MSSFIDLKGMRYGVLEVLEFHSVFQTHARWNCLCHNCYAITDVPSNSLKSGSKHFCRECNGSILSYKEGLDIMTGLDEGKTKVYFTKKYNCSHKAINTAIKHAKRYLNYKEVK